MLKNKTELLIQEEGRRYLSLPTETRGKNKLEPLFDGTYGGN